MSVKGAAEVIFSPPVQNWLKRAIYRHNCRMSPDHYRSALKHWYWLFKCRPCHVEEPRTMTEKIHWLKLYDSTPVKGRLADKFLVRQWVAGKVGRGTSYPCWVCGTRPMRSTSSPSRTASFSRPRMALAGTSSCLTRVHSMWQGLVNACGSGLACARR